MFISPYFEERKKKKEEREKERETEKEREREREREREFRENEFNERIYYFQGERVYTHLTNKLKF